MYLYLGKQEIDDGEKVKVTSVDYLYDTDDNNFEEAFSEFETRGAGKRTFLHAMCADTNSASGVEQLMQPCRLLCPHRGHDVYGPSIDKWIPAVDL